MEHAHFVVFDQTRSESGTLGPSMLLKGSVLELCIAFRQPLDRGASSSSNHPEVRLYTVAKRQPPAGHRLDWNEDLSGERRLGEQEAEEELMDGHAIQAFVYNGDGDCLRHYLVVQAPAPQWRLP